MPRRFPVYLGLRNRIVLAMTLIVLLAILLGDLAMLLLLPSRLTMINFKSVLEVTVLVEIFLVLFTMFVATILANSISKPLLTLISKVRNTNPDDTTTSLVMNRDDEVGELSHFAQNLIKKLQEEKLSVYRKVEDQTSQLNQEIIQTEKTRRALLNVLEDLYEEKRASEGIAGDLKKFQLAVEHASDHIIITDPEGFIIYTNPAAEKTTGFSKREILGTKAGSLWGRKMPKEFYQQMWKVIKTDKHTFVGKVNNRRKNGENYTAETTITPILNKEGEIIFYVGIERDITKTLEVDRMKTEFISLASHQLRTPLGAMKWFCELLLDSSSGSLNEEQKGYVENISRSSERLIELVNSLLDISRIESGRLTIEPLPTNLGKLAAETLSTLEETIKKKQIKVELNVDPELPEISVDPKLISQAYLNLISNAVKYTPNMGAISVKITQTQTDLVSEISDTGVGIPENQLYRVFERFFRADNVMKTTPEGTGLGLYLTRTIISASGGKIWFESKENVGTTFWFSLPKTGSPAFKGEVTLTGTA